MEKLWEIRFPLLAPYLDLPRCTSRCHIACLEKMETLPDKNEACFATDKQRNLEQLSALIQRLKPIDRQVIVSYLEDLDAVSIGEITGLSPANVAMRIHRAKHILARWFREGENHGQPS